MATDVQSLGLFKGLPDNELRTLTRQLHQVRQPAGKEFMVRGEEGIGFLILIDGEAEARMPDGRTRELRPGDYFGEMALLDQEGRSASVVAKTDIRAYAVPEWEFKSFLRDHPEIAYRLLQTLSRRVREAESR